jgi:hypothetical protein
MKATAVCGSITIELMQAKWYGVVQSFSIFTGK